MSLGTVLGFAGAVIGNAILPGIGGTIGMMAGTLLGNLLDPPKYEAVKPQMQAVQTAQYGSPIPILFGTDCFTGTVIWQKWPYTEHKDKSGGKNTSPSVTTTSFSTSFAVLLCEGEIDHIERVYADGRLWWPNGDDTTPFTVYTGTEEQLPDPTMEAEIGAGDVPGYRGWAYVVFNDLMLKDFGERIPQLKFVVAMKGQQNGDITQLASEEADTVWPLYPRITGGWNINWSISQSLPEPAGVVTDPYFYHEDLLGAHRLTRGGTYRYASGEAVDLWQDFCTPSFYCPVGGLEGSEGPWPHLYTIPGLCAKNGTPVAGGPAVEPERDICYAAGVEPGRFVETWCTSQDGTILLVITIDSIGGTDRQWHKIVDGQVVAEGPVGVGISATTAIINIGCGSGGDNVANTVKGVIEPNGKWIWTFRTNAGYVANPTPEENQESVALFYIDSADDTLKQYEAVNGELASYGGPSQSGSSSGAIYCPGEGYCAVVIGHHAQYALYTRFAGGAGSNLAEVINRISAKTGLLDVSEYNTTLCEPIPIDGGRVTGQMEAGNALQPWRQAYFVDATERNGVIVWVPRGGDVCGTFTTADLAARPDGDAPPAIIERDRKSPLELARRVTVTFTDLSFDYQEGAVASDERQVGEARSDTTVNTAIVLSPTKAKQVAKTLLWDDHKGQTSKTWYTSFKHLKYEPTDVVTLPDGVDVRIDNKRILANNIIEFSGVETGGRIYVDSESEVGEGSVIPPQTPPAGKADAKLILIDGPLRSDDDSDYAIKAAVGSATPGKKLSAATIVISRDGGTSWTEIATSGASIIGATTTTLAPWSGGYVIDYTGRVRVELDDSSDVLESVTEEGLYNGANLCLIGAEYLQFGTATLIEEGVYELSMLIRGRKGTEQAASGHGEGEQFVMLDTCIEIPLTSADLGMERQYKAVASGKSVASATVVTFTNSGVAMRCYAPGNITGGGFGNGDVRIDAVRRTRRGGEWQPFIDVPVGETTEKYIWEIWNADFTVCARSGEETTTPSFLYTAAMQTTDFGATQEWVNGKVAQLGAVGAGMFERFRVSGTGSTEDDPVDPQDPYFNWPGYPAPPTPAGPTPAVDVVITTDNNNYPTSGFTIGQRLLFKFHTRTSPAVTAGRIGIAEYGDPPYFRSAKVSTDAKGLSVVAEAGGTAVSFVGLSLSTNTDYYLTLETAFGFGNPSGSIGAPCDVIVYLSDILS